MPLGGVVPLAPQKGHCTARRPGRRGINDEIDEGEGITGRFSPAAQGMPPLPVVILPISV